MGASPGVTPLVDSEARFELCAEESCLRTGALGRQQVHRGSQACLISESELSPPCQTASPIRRRISLIMECPIIEINLLKRIRAPEECRVLNEWATTHQFLEGVGLDLASGVLTGKKVWSGACYQAILFRKLLAEKLFS